MKAEFDPVYMYLKMTNYYNDEINVLNRCLSKLLSKCCCYIIYLNVIIYIFKNYNLFFYVKE